MSFPVEAIFYVEEPPEVEFRGGMFYVTQTVGGYRFVRVMQPSTLLKAARRFQQAANLFSRGASVIAFPDVAEATGTDGH